MVRIHQRVVALIIIFISLTGFGENPRGQIIPLDATYGEFKIVDGDAQFKRRLFLSDMLISNVAWIDNNYILATIGDAPWTENNAAEDLRPRYKSHLQGKLVIIDTDSGEIKDFGLEGSVHCLSGENVVISLSGSSYIQGKQSVALGNLKEPLQITNYKIGQFNEFDCLINQNKRIKRTIKQPSFAKKLKTGDGFFVTEVTYQEGLAYGEWYWEKTTGEKVNILVNPGEEMSKIEFVPHESAYLLVPDLRYMNSYIPWGRTHPNPLFVRLLYSNGEYKRIPVPKVIEDKLKDVKHFFYRDVTYTKSGILWSLFSSSWNSNSTPIYFLQSGTELMKFNNELHTPSPDGCKLMSSSLVSSAKNFLKENSKTDTRNYYIVDLCLGK